MKNNDLMRIMVQGFYGNRSATKIRPEDFDSFMLGYQDAYMSDNEKIDRTIISVPGSEHIVLVYNRYEEEKG